MASDKRDAIVAIALDIHELLKRPSVRDRYVQNIREWIERGRNEDRARDERNQPSLRQLKKFKAGKADVDDEFPERAIETADFNGPAPLCESPPWSVCQCYVATAIIHDSLVADLRVQAIDTVEPICPAGIEYRRFQLRTVKDEAGRFFNHAELLEKPLRDALGRVQEDLTAGGPLNPAEHTSNRRKQRKKRGRPNDTDVDADRRLSEAWGSGHYPTYADLAAAKGIAERDVKRAIDRQRKRCKPTSQRVGKKRAGKARQ